MSDYWGSWKPQDSCFDNKTQLKLRIIKENQTRKVKLNTGDKREYQNETGSNVREKNLTLRLSLQSIVTRYKATPGSHWGV